MLRAMRIQEWVGAWLVLGAVACGGEESPPAATAETPETAEPTAEAQPVEQPAQEQTEAPAEAPAEALPELDLLRALPTEVAASTAYRDRATEVAKLFDGDLETAYNSATGSLVGTWIDVRIPEGATVTGIEMTAGYTRTKPDGEDLFTENHRVRSVKISRDGTELATHDLDLDERGLQRVAVEGGAGTYRIEVTAVQAGSKEDWRETCISELRVLGRAPGAEADARFPLYGVGSLPTREAPTPPAREGFDEQHRQFTHRFATQWAEHEGEVIGIDYVHTGLTLDGEELMRVRRKRTQLLERLQEFVAPIDAAAGDRLRAALVRSPSGRWTEFEPDLAVVEAALQAVSTWADQDSVRCRTAQLLAQIHLERVFALTEGENMHDEMGASYDDGVDIGPDITRFLETMHDLTNNYSRNPGPTTRRVLAQTLPRANLEPLTQSWAAARPMLEAARGACPWGSE